MASFGYKPSPSMRDTSESSNPMDEWARSEERSGWVSGTNPAHLAQIETITRAVQAGQISPEGVANLSKRVKGLAPYINSALASRETDLAINRDVQGIVGKYINEGRPAMPEQGQSSGDYSADPSTEFRPAQPAIPSMRNYQGAVDALAANPAYLPYAEKYREIGGLSKADRGEYYTPVYDKQGRLLSFNARSGQVTEPETPVVGAKYSPELQGKIEYSKETGKTYGESQAKSNIELPGAEIDALQSVKLVDDLLKHPGLKLSVGPGGLIPKVPGTRQADFITRLEQLQGRQFMDARQLLKGGGQITDFEGKKAEQGIARMQRAQSAEEFKAGAREYQDAVRSGVAKLRGKSGRAQTDADMKKPSGVSPVLTDREREALRKRHGL